MTLVETAACSIRNIADRNPDILQRIEEQTIQHINNWLFERLSNEDAVKLMDDARAYNTEHYGVKYPERPRDNVLIKPDLEDYKMLIEKAADYLRQYYSSDDPSSLYRSEEQIIARIHGWIKNKMSNDEAVKLMDAAREHNTKHYGIKYPKRRPDNIIIMPDSKHDPILTAKVADCLLQAYDESKPERLPDIEEQIIIDLKFDTGILTNEEAIKLMDAAREHNTKQHGIKYPERPRDQIIVMPIPMPASDYADMVMKKAAYYLRHMCKGKNPDVPESVEIEIIERLQSLFEKMRNEEAIKLMDDARAYNTEHYGIRYPERPRDATLVKPYFKSHESLVKDAAKHLRDGYKRIGPLSLQHHEELTVKYLETKMGRLTNEEAIEIMDDARVYNTKNHGIQYPDRPQDNIVTMPPSYDDPMMIQKAADYLRQVCAENRTELLPDIEEQVVFELEEYTWMKMTNDEAVKLMDDARAYNTERYGIKYPECPRDRVIIRPNISSPEDAELIVQKAAYHLRQLCDGKDPERVEGQVINRLKHHPYEIISNEDAVRIMDDARAYNTEHYGIRYPARQARQIIVQD